LDEITRRFLVLGKVQGVYFRHSSRLEAIRLAIRGYARNLPDGSVEVLAHGALASVEELRAWLTRGPPQAWVDEVRETPPGDAGPFPEGFSIL
jgi:acylphosphatase